MNSCLWGLGLIVLLGTTAACTAEVSNAYGGSSVAVYDEGENEIARAEADYLTLEMPWEYEPNQLLVAQAKATTGEPPAVVSILGCFGFGNTAEFPGTILLPSISGVACEIAPHLPGAGQSCYECTLPEETFEFPSTGLSSEVVVGNVPDGNPALAFQLVVQYENRELEIKSAHAKCYPHKVYLPLSGQAQP